VDSRHVDAWRGRACRLSDFPPPFIASARAAAESSCLGAYGGAPHWTLTGSLFLGHLPAPFRACPGVCAPIAGAASAVSVRPTRPPTRFARPRPAHVRCWTFVSLRRRHRPTYPIPAAVPLSSAVTARVIGPCVPCEPAAPARDHMVGTGARTTPHLPATARKGVAATPVCVLSPGSLGLRRPAPAPLRLFARPMLTPLAAPVVALWRSLPFAYALAVFRTRFPLCSQRSPTADSRRPPGSASPGDSHLRSWPPRFCSQVASLVPPTLGCGFLSGFRVVASLALLRLPYWPWPSRLRMRPQLITCLLGATPSNALALMRTPAPRAAFVRSSVLPAYFRGRSSP